MATATTKRASVTFVLELDEVEAQYVEAALVEVSPRHLEDDTVYHALTNAMRASDVPYDGTALA